MDIIITMVGGVTKLGILGLMVVSCFTAYTKPTRDSFIKYFKLRARKENGSSIASPFIHLVDMTTDTFDYKDYFFFSTVTININDKKDAFLGVANNWFSNLNL